MCSGLPLGVVEDAPYETIRTKFQPGDHLLLFGDGATEIHNAKGQLLGVDGLIGILKNLGHPESRIESTTIEKELLKYSNDVGVEDDVTPIEIRFA